MSQHFAHREARNHAVHELDYFHQLGETQSLLKDSGFRPDLEAGSKQHDAPNEEDGSVLESIAQLL